MFLIMGLLTACSGPGLLGSGLYRTRMGGPMAAVGMTATDVDRIMGPSWQKFQSATRGEVWHYGYNLLGMVGPSCQYGARGGSIGCIAVYFRDGRVIDVVYY